MPDNTRPNNEEAVPMDDPASARPENPKDSYEGRKYEPNIDGPEQTSQETDEVFVDPRKEEDLPPGGKNVADLNAHDLSQKNNP
ncbi:MULTISPECIES: hypothetical protein [unclassified Psychrobacter]|uniref:hypothetical protein n=1 Tax=unclassified Psychrobacter TaxID=196806 RepID=UPI00071E88CA|nr:MULTISPECIES: hypothetical protein [unclassified Psychrobacter]OLF39193.1 hypothetical protein BTV98_01960 [Psychrobacter sp. Cmf 22.2]